jgi:hypothetical protein
MYKIDELIAKLQATLAAAKEATAAAKNADLPNDALAQVEDTEARIKATLDAMIDLGHQRGSEGRVTVRKKPLEIDPSRTRGRHT